jgi:hypothetical protein
LSQPQITLSGPSQVRASDKSGIGCKPDPEQLRRYQLDYAGLEAGNIKSGGISQV